MSEKKPVLIDVEQIVKEKAGKKFKFIPRFVISYLKKIIHEDELNECLTIHAGDEGMDFINSSLDFIGVKVDLQGAENFPKEGLCTFVSNHPLGGPDGLTLGQIVGNRYEGKVRFLLNSFLMKLQPLTSLGISVNKMGGQARSLPQQVDSIFASDNQVVMFPAGICSRRRHGVIRDLEWRKTFILKSIQYHRDVVPIYFGGRNSDFFYRLANISKRLGIKFNFAMLYLSDEMFKNRGKTFKVVIGKPISWESFDKSKSASEWAQYVKEEVYKLAEK